MGIPDVAQRLHWESEWSKQIGNPMAYDYGIMRECWLNHYLNDWVGDDGWVFRQHDEMRKFNYIGDTHIISGEVTGTRVEDGRCYVDIGFRATNQRGTVTAPGSATVLLPSREHGPVVLPSRQQNCRRRRSRPWSGTASSLGKGTARPTEDSLQRPSRTRRVARPEWVPGMVPRTRFAGVPSVQLQTRGNVMTIVDRQPVPLHHVDRLFIGGAWVEPSSDAVIDVIDPATEERFLRVPAASAADVARAVAAARDAFDRGPWPTLSHAERADYLRQLGKAVADRAEDLGQIWPRESGALYTTAVAAGQFAGMPFDAYAALADTFPFEERAQPTMGGVFGLLVREPVGVVGAIIPWNAP